MELKPTKQKTLEITVEQYTRHLFTVNEERFDSVSGARKALRDLTSSLFDVLEGGTKQERASNADAMKAMQKKGAFTVEDMMKLKGFARERATQLLVDWNGKKLLVTGGDGKYKFIQKAP